MQISVFPVTRMSFLLQECLSCYNHYNYKYMWLYLWLLKDWIYIDILIAFSYKCLNAVYYTAFYGRKMEKKMNKMVIILTIKEKYFWTQKIVEFSKISFLPFIDNDTSGKYPEPFAFSRGPPTELGKPLKCIYMKRKWRQPW